MTKEKLYSKEKDCELYRRIVAIGTMEDMFDFAYSCGCENILRKQLETLNDLNNN